MSMKKDKIPVTQLLIGNSKATNMCINQQLQQLFCVSEAQQFCACIVCKQINARQHHAIRWYTPEKQYYTIAQLESLFDAVRFTLDNGEHFVFVLEHADALSLSCANSLLKTLEEPAAGYHFILTTNYPALVLPTIYSRCVVYECKGGENALQAEQFLAFFKNPKKTELYECMKEFDKAKITENMTKMLMDDLIRYWMQQYALAIANGESARAQQALQYMNTLTNFLSVLPMPGSAKLFWKTVYTAMIF